MARGQDAPTIKGGEIDPYVAQSLAASKQQSENRLLTAMQEAGAAQRQKSSQTAGLVQQGMAAANEQQRQAAEFKQQDKRAAESERARREDQIFEEKQSNIQREFLAEQGKIQKEYEIAAQKKNWARADVLRAEDLAFEKVRMTVEIARAEQNTKVLLGAILQAGERETATERLKTSIWQESQKADEARTMHETLVKETIDLAKTDKRLDLPAASDIKRRLEEAKSLPGLALRMATRPVNTLEESFGLYREAQIGLKRGFADPYGVLQTRLAGAGVSISVEDLSPTRILNIEQQLADGTLSSIDLRKTIGVLDGMTEVLREKKETASAGEKDFWNDKYSGVVQMRSSVVKLLDSTRKITGNEIETVGSRVRDALGPVIPGLSLGSRAAALMAQNGKNLDATLKEMLRPMEPIQEWPVPVDASPAEKKAWEFQNSIIRQVYQKPTETIYGGD